MRESASAPLASTAPAAARSAATAHPDVLKTAIQIQVQVEALTNTAQAAAKQARLLTQHVGALAEVRRSTHRSPPRTDRPPQPDRALQLQAANARLTRDLARAREEGEAWRTLAQNVQEMQELAMAAFARCNALETENRDLRRAMHAFAEGSASATVQELQRIIAGLTDEVAQHKKREEDVKAREKSLRSKENNVIIKAMRKQTKELKVGRRIAQHNLTILTMSAAALVAIHQARRGSRPREQESQHAERGHTNHNPAEEPSQPRARKPTPIHSPPTLTPHYRQRSQASKRFSSCNRSIASTNKRGIDLI